MTLWAILNYECELRLSVSMLTLLPSSTLQSKSEVSDWQLQTRTRILSPKVFVNSLLSSPWNNNIKILFTRCGLLGCHLTNPSQRWSPQAPDKFSPGRDAQSLGWARLPVSWSRGWTLHSSGRRSFPEKHVHLETRARQLLEASLTSTRSWKRSSSLRQALARQAAFSEHPTRVLMKLFIFPKNFKSLAQYFDLLFLLESPYVWLLFDRASTTFRWETLLSCWYFSKIERSLSSYLFSLSAWPVAVTAVSVSNKSRSWFWLHGNRKAPSMSCATSDIEPSDSAHNWEGVKVARRILSCTTLANKWRLD